MPLPLRKYPQITSLNPYCNMQQLHLSKVGPEPSPKGRGVPSRGAGSILGEMVTSPNLSSLCSDGFVDFVKVCDLMNSFVDILAMGITGSLG